MYCRLTHLVLCNMETILLFIKIGSEEYMRDLYENGTIYMNTLRYFRKVEDGGLRGDPYECASDIVDRNDATIRLPFMDEDIKPARIRYSSRLDLGNLYCLYCVSSNGLESPGDFTFDERNLRFGTHCVIIKQPGIFFEKVSSELEKMDHYYRHGFVEYYEKKEVNHGLTPFHKSNGFDYQREFRFFVENEEDQPIRINIGNMESYAEMFEARGLETLKLT